MNRPSFVRSVLVLALLVGGPLAWTAVSHGQEAPPNRQRGGGRGGPGGFGGGGFGGGGFGGGGSQSLLDFANRDEKAREEIKLSDDDKAKIKELSDSQRADMQAAFGRMQPLAQDATDEERQKVRDEMTKEGAERRKIGDAKLKEILSKEQITRLEQLWLRQAGHSALSRDEIASALKLTDEQKAAVKKIQDDYQEQSRAGGFRMPADEREKLRADRDTKLATVLTADQSKVWEEKLGPAPAETADTTKPASDTAATTTPATGTSSTPPSSVAAATKATTEPTGKVVARLLDIDKPQGKSDEPSDEPVVKKPSGEKMSFNFRFAPWELVMKMFAEEAGLTLDMATPPPGTFNYYDKGKYSVTEALDILNGYLLQKGFVLVRRDQFLVVLNIDNPIPPNLIPQVLPEDLATHGKNELLSVIFSLNGQDLATAAEEVKAMLGPQGKVVTLAKANRLLVMDIGANLRRINVLLNGAEGEGPVGASGFKAFQLKHISATEAEKTVRDLFSLAPRSRTSTSTTSRTPTSSSSSYYRPDDRRDDQRRDDQRRDDRGQPYPVPMAPTPAKERVTLATDLRTNSLMVTASAADIAIVEQAIKTIDVADASGRSGSAADGGQPQLEVYSLVTADPTIVATTLNSLIPGLTINEDLKAKKLHVYASPGDQRQVRSIINQLDGTASETVSVFPLKRSDPVQVVGTLRSLFVGRREDMPSIEADVAGKRLVIRGTAEQLVQIRTVLQQLGEDGQGGAGLNGVGEGPIRTLSAGKRDPRDLISLVERIWSTSTDRNPIHVVVPSAISPATRNIPERRVPSAPPSESGGEEDEELQEDDVTAGAIVVDEPKPVAKEPPGARPTSDASFDDLLRELMELLDEEAKEKSAVKPAGKSITKTAASTPNADGDANPERRTTGKASKLPIAISANGNNLIISSDDLEALDRLERLIQSLTQSSSSTGTRWTVFYLRSADAAETATMLGHLFPTGSVSKTSTDSTLMGSLTSGFSSLGGSLMDMTGLNSLGKDTALRIIPEPRSNALFISGTDDQIRQVEDVLKILDAAEMPESLKDRSQHMIALEYADVHDVHEIVKDVYKEEIEGQGNPFGMGSRSGSRDINPLAMMMGGMAGGQSGRGQKGPQLTVGVDNRTNTLIVNANDKLFKQVETLVKSVDEAAKVAKQTVRVIPLENANSTIVSQALGSMLGKVKVSTTGGSSTRDSSSRGSSSSSPPPFGMSPFGMSPFGSSGSSSSDAMRQYWQSRMSGGSPFGGGGFPSSDGGRSSDRGRSSDSGRSRGDR